jgi:hypothetical protein
LPSTPRIAGARRRTRLPGSRRGAPGGFDPARASL